MSTGSSQATCEAVEKKRMGKDQNKIYVLQVGGGQEKHTILLITQLVSPDVYTEVFSPKFLRKMKLAGEWRMVEVPLVPGYLFITTNDIAALSDALYHVPTLTKLLHIGSGIVPLDPEEVAWMDRLTKPHERTVAFSEGYIVGDKVTITSGPLQGYESEIQKIDRHKRFAYLAFNIMGRNKNVRVGLEIVSKLPGPKEA